MTNLEACGTAAPHTRFTLRPDQLLARDAILRTLRDHDRTLLVSACGTGKTVTLHSVVDERDAEGRQVNTLIAAFFPSIALVDQTLRSWQQQYGGLWATPIVVCSDKTAGSRGDDELVFTDSELESTGAHVTRDPAEIAGILVRHRARAFQTPLVVFSTYQSADKVAEAQKLAGDVEFDIAILDEAHRAKSLGANGRLTLDAEQILARKRVSATATPKVTHLGQRGHHVESVTDLDMVADTGFGPIAHEFGLRDAIDAGVLVDYQIRIMVISPQEAADAMGWKGIDPASIDPASADTRMALGVAALARMKRLGMRRSLVYLSSRARAHQFADTTRALNVVDIDVITGDMPMKTTTDRQGRVRRGRDAILDTLKAAGGAIANVKCLTEGVDIPELDAVLFVDPRNDKVDLVQAVGRAIRRGTLGKERGYVILPVLEAPTDVDQDEWQDRAGFKRVWDVLREMAQNDTALRKVIYDQSGRGAAAPEPAIDGGSAAGFGGGTPDDSAIVVEGPARESNETDTPAEEPRRAGDRTHDSDPVTLPLNSGGEVTARLDIVAMAKVLMRQASLRTVDLLDGNQDTYRQRLANLRAFIAEHGDGPKQGGSRPGEAKLEKWVGHRVQDRKSGRIQPGSERDLELTGLLGDMWWDRFERDHQLSLADLRAFIAEHGEEPKDGGTRPGEAKLATWVDSRSQDRKAGRLLPGSERDLELMALLGDMWWDKAGRRYQRSLADLRAFIAEHGEEPKDGGTRPGEAKLATWVKNRARDRKAGRIPPGSERDQELTALLGDLWWDRFERDYQRSLADLRAFIAQYSEEPKHRGVRPGETTLASWRSKRSQDRKAGRIPPGSERDQELTALLGDLWWDKRARTAAHR